MRVAASTIIAFLLVSLADNATAAAAGRCSSPAFLPSRRTSTVPGGGSPAANDDPSPPIRPRTSAFSALSMSTTTFGDASSVGDADRSFRQGISLEKFGLTRAAAAAFHESATLYQCFLDHHRDATGAGLDGEGGEGALLGGGDGGILAAAAANEFGHVTDLHPSGPNSCRAVLAYACVRLAHLSHDALGDSKAAARLYREATSIDPSPSAVSYDGVGTSVEASGGDLEEAAAAYGEAARLGPRNGAVNFHRAVALERLGRTDEAELIFDVLRRGGAELSCLVDSWGYVRWHTRKIARESNNIHRGTRDMLRIGLDAAQSLVENENGLVLEFGVGSGRSIRMIQEMVPLDVPVHGFDTFTGLPHAWGSEPAGAYSTGGSIPNLEGEVYFHKGLFKDTVSNFLEGTEKYQPLAFANVDCDLYGSTLDILEGLYSRVVPGTVLAFDEYLCHPTWRQDEFRAWRECCKRFGWHYEYLGFSLSTKQAVVRVTEA
uniref:Uncharacterized protein n=1 Tax=Odontella aurita TaxID=265563 RepID=A0A7S4JM60_9STRA